MPGNYGIKISFPNKDVKTVGLKDLMFHSKYPFLKKKAQGSGSAVLTDGGAGFDVLLHTHNLGYAPIALVFSQYYDPFLNSMVTEFVRMPYVERSAGGVIRASYVPIVNTTELRYQASATSGSNTGNKTINYYWIVYYDPE